MTESSLRFALFGNVYQTRWSDAPQRVVSSLRRHGASIAVDRDYFNYLQSAGTIDLGRVEVFEGDHFEADFAVSMGGDGTLLRTAGRVGRRQTPIVGVNMGRLGFLTDVGQDEVEVAVDAICRGDYVIDNRAVIEVEPVGGARLEAVHALNDVAILKTDTAAMISIRASVNGDDVTTYQADGLIVSTPTGSTAYSLSNGGPIIVPGTKVFSMTAVAPHSLNVRPIVLPDSSVIELEVESRSHNFLVAIDGRSEKCREGTKVTLRRAPYDIKVVKRPDHRYFNTLREKMMWGADTR